MVFGSAIREVFSVIICLLRGIFQKKHDKITDRAGQDDSFLISDHDMEDHWCWEREKTAALRMTVDGAREKGNALLVGDHVAGGIQITDLTENIGRVGTLGENFTLETPEVAVLLVEDERFIFKQTEIDSVFFKERDAWMGIGKSKHEFLIAQRHEFKHAVARFPCRNDGDVCHSVCKIVFGDRGIAIDRADSCVRMELSEIRQNVRGKIRQECIIIYEGNLTLSGLLEFPDLFESMLIDALDGARSIHIDFSGICENHFISLTQEKFCADTVFHALELTADSRLGDEKTVGGA